MIRQVDLQKQFPGLMKISVKRAIKIAYTRGDRRDLCVFEGTLHPPIAQGIAAARVRRGRRIPDPFVLWLRATWGSRGMDYTMSVQTAIKHAASAKQRAQELLGYFQEALQLVQDICEEQKRVLTQHQKLEWERAAAAEARRRTQERAENTETSLALFR